jgi:Fe-S-cluster containining protein
MKPLALTTILYRGKTGTIRLAQGGGGPLLQFDLDCLEALPYCQARCCALEGMDVDRETLEAGVLAKTLAKRGLRFAHDGDTTLLPRRADGYCAANDPQARTCTCYDQRPATCQHFHCTRNADTRGWALELHRF